MALYKVNSDTADLTKVAGGTLYADLPIGSWIKNDMATIPSGFLKVGDTISQSECPELYSKYGSTVPYKADKSELSDYENISNSFTAQYDGFLNVSSAGATGVTINIIINGTTIATNSNSSYGANGISAVLKKGDTVSVTGDNPSGANKKVAYYKKSLIVKAKHTPVPADFIDSVDDVVETELGLKSITLARVNVDSNSGAWAYKSGKVVNVNLAALVTLNQTTPSGTILYSGFPKPALGIVRFGLIDAQTVDVVTGLVQINSAGNLVADGQGLKTDTAYWGSFTYLTNE